MAYHSTNEILRLPEIRGDLSKRGTAAGNVGLALEVYRSQQSLMQRLFFHSGRLLLSVVLLVASATAAKLEGTSAERYVDHVEVLAAPEMKGRGAGSPELERAGQYIAKQFEAVGLEPALGGESYLQPFGVTTGGEMGEGNRLVIRTPEGEISLRPGRDYVPLNFSSAGSVSGQVVFAGYGVSADERGYDDYTHFDAKDKIVLLLRYEPKFFTKKGPSGQQRPSHHAHLISKAINARDRGAKAVILVNGKLDPGKKDELLKFGAVAGPENAGTLMVHMKNKVADRWLKGADTSLAKLQEEMASSSRRVPERFPPAASEVDSTSRVPAVPRMRRRRSHARSAQVGMTADVSIWIVIPPAQPTRKLM